MNMTHRLLKQDMSNYAVVHAASFSVSISLLVIWSPIQQSVISAHTFGSPFHMLYLHNRPQRCLFSVTKKQVWNQHRDDLGYIFWGGLLIITFVCFWLLIT